MQPREIIEREKRFLDSTGGIAKRLCIHVQESRYFGRYGRDEKPLSASVYAERPEEGRGFSSEHRREESVLHIEAETWEELFDALPLKWEARLGELEADLIHRMAVLIIDLTEKNGSCQRAALRQGGFNDAELDRLSKLACAKADKMASNGPFSISIGGKANAR